MLPQAFPIRFLLNARVDPAAPFGSARDLILGPEVSERAYREISSWDGYAPTPLRQLEGAANALRIGSLWYKDEGTRFGLGSFKALGGMYGVFQVLKTVLEREAGPSEIGSDMMMDGAYTDALSRITITCASAGNHGRAVARGAQMFGCRAVIFLPAHTSGARIAAIRRLGAETVLVRGGFDEAVGAAAREADAEGWHVVADTTFPGYREVPGFVMQGYTVLAREVQEQLPKAEDLTHVFLQAGVGGLAGAVTGHLWRSLGPRRPKVVIVEPAEADCLLQSGLAGAPVPSVGSLKTSMDCLACRNVSELSWEILRDGADAFITVSDTAVEETVALLSAGVGRDPPIPTQPSGAAGFTGLIAALFEPALADPLGLGEESRVLVIGTEGPPEKESS